MSAGLNVRPVVPRGTPAGRGHLLRMTGDYVFWDGDYATRLLMLDGVRAR